MLVVVERNSKTREVSVLDTDDMVVESINFDEARKLKVDISGLMLESEIKKNQALKFMFEHSLPNALQFRAVSVCWQPFDFTIESVTDLPYVLFGKVNFGKHIQKYTGISYFMFYFLSLRSLCYTNALQLSISYDEKSFEVQCVDDIVIFYLSYLYKLRSGSSACELRLFSYNNEILFNVKRAMAGTEVFDYNDDVYFCDSQCVLSVSSKYINALDELRGRFVENTKHIMLKTGLRVCLSTGEVNVQDCSSLTIRDDRVYMLSGGVTIDILQVINNNAKFCIASNTVLYVKKYHDSTDGSNTVELFNCIDPGTIQECEITLKSYFNESVSSYLDSIIRDTCFALDIIDVDNVGDFLKFVYRFIGIINVDKLRRGISVDDLVYKKMSIICMMKNRSLLPRDLYELLNYQRYTEVSSNYFNMYYMRNVKDFDYKYVPTIAVENYLPDNHMFNTVEAVDRIYDDMYKKIRSLYDKAREVAYETDLPMNVSTSDFKFFVSYNIKGTTSCISLSNMDDYKEARLVEAKVANLSVKLNDIFHAKPQIAVGKGNSVADVKYYLVMLSSNGELIMPDVKGLKKARELGVIWHVTSVLRLEADLLNSFRVTRPNIDTYYSKNVVDLFIDVDITDLKVVQDSDLVGVMEKYFMTGGRIIKCTQRQYDILHKWDRYFTETSCKVIKG